MSQTKAQLIDAVDGSIVTADIADDAINADKLASNAVVNASVDANAAIAASKIADFVTGNTNNRVLTASGTANSLIGEANLTFDGATLNIDGNTTDTPLILDTSNTSGSHLRFRKDGVNKIFLGCGGGFGLGDVDDLSLRTTDNIIFGVSTSEKMRIDGSGRLLIGHSANLHNLSLQVIGGSGDTSSIALSRFSASAASPNFVFHKSRSNSIGTNTVLQNNDTVGIIRWNGADGTDYSQVADIQAAIDGTPGSNDMPGRLVFSTTADGSQFTTERMRIDSSGTIFSFSTNDTTPNIKWRSDDTNWFGSLNQSVEGSTISTFISTGGDWSANGTTYSATKAIASFETRAIALHPQFNNGAGKVAFLQKAAGSSTTDGTVTEICNIDNGGIKPGSDNAVDLGSASFRWRNLYTTDLKLSNEGSQNDVDSTWGNYTIQEGHEDLFLLNHRTGKKFKFNLTEVA